MLKNILKTVGVQELSKNEQKEIDGGKKKAPECFPGEACGVNMICDQNGQCTIFNQNF